MALSTEAVLAMPHGTKLNKAVHEIALGRIGRPKPYSTNLTEASAIIDLLPIFGGRVGKNADGYDENKPYLGGVLEYHKELKAYYGIVAVKCATLPIALCKAALLYTIQPKDRRAAPTIGAFPKLGTRPQQPVLDPMPPRTLEVKLPPKPDAPQS